MGPIVNSGPVGPKFTKLCRDTKAVLKVIVANFYINTNFKKEVMA